MIKKKEEKLNVMSTDCGEVGYRERDRICSVGIMEEVVMEEGDSVIVVKIRTSFGII